LILDSSQKDTWCWNISFGLATNVKTWKFFFLIIIIIIIFSSKSAKKWVPTFPNEYSFWKLDMIFGTFLQIMNRIWIKFFVYWCKGLEVWILKMGSHFTFGDPKFKEWNLKEIWIKWCLIRVSYDIKNVFSRVKIFLWRFFNK